MSIYHVASYGALQGETDVCALLVCHENQNSKVTSLSDAQSLSDTGKHILFALGNATGSITIYGRNGVEVRVEDPTSGTKFLLFSNSGRYLISVALRGSITTWSLTGEVPELVGHIPKCLWQQDDMEVSCVAASDNFLFFGTNKGAIHVASVDCKYPSGYFVSAERAAPELLEMYDKAGPVCCIAPEPKVGSTVLICYRQMVVLWDWEKTRRLNSWSVPEHESSGDVVDIAWNDCGSHFAVGLSSGIYSVVCVSMAESKRGNGRLVLHPRLIDVEVPVDLSSISDFHTPVFAVEWLGTSLLIAGGRPLGSGGEEMPGGITTIEGLVYHDSSKDIVRKSSRYRQQAASQQIILDPVTSTLFSPLWQPGEDVIWMKATPMGYTWLLISSMVESSSIPWSLEPPGLQYDRKSRLLIYESPSLHSEARGCDDESPSNHNSFVILPHLFAFPEVTAACDLGLLHSLDSQNMTIGLETSVKSILHGGVLSWSKFIPHECQDEALSLTQVVILGHADATLTLWDVSGHDQLSTEDVYGAGTIYQQPSLELLGSINLGHGANHTQGNGCITTLHVLDRPVRQDEQYSCGWYIAVGFSSGLVSVFRLGHQSEESFPLSPEITNVTFVRTSTERQAENQSCLSAIDDLSIQIEKAKAKASKISSEFLGDFGPPSVSSCMSGSNSTLRTIEKEFSMGCKPTSENLPPLPVKAYELILRLHSNSITALDLCWDPRTMLDSPIMLACDEGGVVSISHIATREVIIPSCEVPVCHPRPCIKFGPYPSTLRKEQVTDDGNDSNSCSLALYLLVDDLLSLYSPVTGKLLLSLDLRIEIFDPSRCPRGCLDPFWLIFTNAQGLPLKNERGGRWITSDGGEDVELDIIPHVLMAHAGMIMFLSCASLLGEGKKQSKCTNKGGRLTLVGSHQLSKGQRIRGFNLIFNNPGQLSIPLEAEADTESGGSNGAVSSCVVLVDVSGRVQCFSMPHLASLPEEKDEYELGALRLVSPPLRTRPISLCLELGSERSHLPPVVLVSSTGDIFVQIGPRQVDVFSVLHLLNITGTNHHDYAYRGGIRRCMNARLLVKGSNLSITLDDESSVDLKRTIWNSSLFPKPSSRKANFSSRGSKQVDSVTPIDGLLLPKWEEVFVVTALDSPDSWTNSCLKQELFDSANSRNLPDQNKNTRGGGDTCDEVKSTMQDNVRMLHERGEKLDRMNNKVNSLKNRTQTFEEMAKDVNKSMERKSCKVS